MRNSFSQSILLMNGNLVSSSRRNAINMRGLHIHSINFNDRFFRNYGLSTVSQPVNRRTFATYDKPKSIQVQDEDRIRIEPEEEYVDYVGFDLMMDRATKIMNAMAQRDVFLVLQTHCNTKLPSYLEGKTNYCLYGCTDSPEIVEQGKSVYQYSGVNLVDYSKELPYTTNSHNFVIHMHPSPSPDPNLQSEVYVPPARVPSPPLREVFRIVAQGGYCVVGAPKRIWEDEDMSGLIEKLEEEKEVMFCSLQMLPLDRPVDFRYKEHSTEGVKTENEIDWDSKEEMYYICLVRKL